MPKSHGSTGSVGAQGKSTGFAVEPSALTTMSSKLANLGGELESAGTKAGSAHPGGDAFGVVGQAFGGKLGGLLGQAQQHIGGVSTAAHGASGKLKATVTDLHENETSISKRLDGIADPEKAPATHNPGPVNLQRSTGPGGRVHTPPATHGPGAVNRAPAQAPGGQVHAPPRTRALSQDQKYKQKIQQIRDQFGGQHAPGKLDPLPPGKNNGDMGQHTAVDVTGLSSRPNQPPINLLMHRPNLYINGFTRPNPNGHGTQAFHFPGTNALSGAPQGATAQQLHGKPGYPQDFAGLKMGQGPIDDALHTLGTSDNHTELTHAVHTLGVNVSEPARMNSVYDHVHGSVHRPADYDGGPVPANLGNQIHNWGDSSTAAESMDQGALHWDPNLALHNGHNPNKT